MTKRGGRRRFSYRDLADLVKEGLCDREIGERLGLTRSGVTRARGRAAKMNLTPLTLAKTETSARLAPEVKVKPSMVVQAISMMGSEGFSALRRLDKQAQVIEKENDFTLKQMQALDPDKAECTRDVTCPGCNQVFPIMISSREEVLAARMKVQDRIVKNAAEIRQQLEVIKTVLK